MSLRKQRQKPLRQAFCLDFLFCERGFCLCFRKLIRRDQFFALFLRETFFGTCKLRYYFFVIIRFAFRYVLIEIRRNSGSVFKRDSLFIIRSCLKILLRISGILP